jgi:hypothetical protein
MTNVTKVVRPFFEKYVNRSMVEPNILSGALFNVMPRNGLVSVYHSKYISVLNYS